jgi:hypothetical protein
MKLCVSMMVSITPLTWWTTITKWTSLVQTTHVLAELELHPPRSLQIVEVSCAITQHFP